MTTLLYAPIRENGVDFVVVAVKEHVMQNRPYADGMVSRMCEFFRQPAVLVTEHSSVYFGRSDLVNFLTNYQPGDLPWHNTNLH